MITGGNTVTTLHDTDEDDGIVVTAISSTLSANLKGDWQFKFMNVGVNAGSDSGLVGIFGFTLPMNLSTEALTNPSNGYGYRSDGMFVYTYGNGQIDFSTTTGATYTAGDVIGVHLDGTSLSFSKNGVSQGAIFPDGSAPAFNLSHPYVAGVMGHHIQTTWSCIV